MKDIQSKVKSFTNKYELESPVEHRVLDMVSELGELAKEVLKMSNYGRGSIQYRKELETEIGDVFYSLITIANTFDIDMQEALYKSLLKYEKRLAKGSAGSEND